MNLGKPGLKPGNKPGNKPGFKPSKNLVIPGSPWANLGLRIPDPEIHSSAGGVIRGKDGGGPGPPTFMTPPITYLPDHSNGCLS